MHSSYGTVENTLQQKWRYYDVPSAEDWKRVGGVYDIVESIYKVVDALFERKCSTANVYLYHLHDIKVILTKALLIL